jgi:hypothetical protein
MMNKQGSSRTRALVIPVVAVVALGGVAVGYGALHATAGTNPRQTGQFTISVHDGRLHGNTLTANLYVQQQFGLYYTAIEGLRCTTVAGALHCHMHTQIAQKVFDSAQTFYRR